MWWNWRFVRADDTMDDTDGDVGLISSLNRAAGEARRGFIDPLASTASNATQIDLNDAAHLADLEDAGLMSHMEEARAQLLEQLKEISRLPSSAEVTQADTAARCALSGIITEISDQKMTLASVRDRVVLHASDIEKLSAGLLPYGFPSAHGTHPCADRGQLLYLCTKVSTSGNEIEQIWNRIHRLENSMMRARREIETALVGLERRGTYFETAWKQLHDTLQ